MGKNLLGTTIQLKVNEYADMMTDYITSTTMNKSLKDIKKSSFMLWGSPGIGKSDSLKSIKKNVEKSTGKKVVITDVRLLLFNPVDLRGIPVPDANKEFAIWLKPYLFQMDSSEDIINILMLDEISAAAPSVQAAAYQITLDRKIGEHQLPDNCYVICAGNRLQDKSVAYKMPKALANRLTHFEIVSNLDDWKQWAMNKGIDEKVIGYLNWQPNKLNEFDSSSDDNAFPTPRSWEMVDQYLKVFGSLQKAFNCIAGSIGLGTASEFKTYCEVYKELPNIKDIFDGKEKSVPKKPDTLYALTSSISAYAKDATVEQLNNILNYTLLPQMQIEFSILIMKDMLLIDGLKNKIIQCQDFNKWLEKNKGMIMNI